MRKFILILAMIAVCGIVHAQMLTPTVISSSGGFYSNSAGQLSFTVAEMTMVQTFSQTNNILTQGFQQPFDFGVGIPEVTKEGFAFTVYPNPSSGNIQLVLNTKSNEIVNLRLVDVLGKTVESDHFTHGAGANSYAYNWNNLANGMYMLEVILTNPVTNVSKMSMKKINIIY